MRPLNPSKSQMNPKIVSTILDCILSSTTMSSRSLPLTLVKEFDVVTEVTHLPVTFRLNVLT